MERAQVLQQLKVKTTATGASIEYAGVLLAPELGVGIPIDGRWLWSFDRSLALSASEETIAGDVLGEYSSLALTYADVDGPMVRQEVKAYQETSTVVVETTALRELRGTAIEDNFFETTFNSPVVRLHESLSYIAYTWGLLGGEGVGVAGHFPDAALARDLASLPEQLRLADFSPSHDVNHTGKKPFAPLIGYDAEERTLVMSPLDHYLISPLRLLETPDGPAVARGLHGLVNVVPAGAATRTIMTFGAGLAATVVKWGGLLARAAGKDPKKPKDSLLTSNLGFWNCYGGYYAELFRPTTADTLEQLADDFREASLPVRYWGLDLWYRFDTVGFARGYLPNADKYPEGLKRVFDSTQIPYLLHMSSFDRANDYQDSHDMLVDEGSAYPRGPELYQDLARQFKALGAIGIWHDFLRTLLQNCRSLRDRMGAADQWFEDLATSMAQEDLDVMLCMPTMGHYLASAAYDNVVAIRTSTDYVNHQEGQRELLAHQNEYRRTFSPQRNLRQNLMLAFVAGAVGLAPSYDVFISNEGHPAGFANPHAARDALTRALSAGIVGVGDKLGHVDQEVVSRLAFPDGVLAQPDHPSYPVASFLQSNTPVFRTETLVSGYSWIYLTLFNLGEDTEEYVFDLEPIVGATDNVVFDYHAATVITGRVLRGRVDPGEGRYLIVAPLMEGLHPLGFPDKYVTLSSRQVKGVTAAAGAVTIDLELPAGSAYTFATVGVDGLSAMGQGLSVTAVDTRGALTCVDFRVESRSCSLVLRA